LRRLATIDEAGNPFDYFTPGVGAFCGAELEHQHYGQIIVMENLDPTEALHADSVDVPFTRRRNVGVATGSFPSMWGSNECWTRRKHPVSRPLR
jgi:hypothetical protein